MSVPIPPAQRRPTIARPVLSHAARMMLLAAVCALPGATQARPPAPAEPALGRLFHTPAQRAALDQARDRPPPLAGRSATAPLAPSPALLSVDGIVRRDDGQATVWINQQPTRAPANTGAVRIGPVRDASDTVELRVPDTARRLRLKVGQEANPDSGEVRDHYRRAPPPVPAASSPPDVSAPAAAPVPPVVRRPAHDGAERRDAAAIDETPSGRARPLSSPARSVP